jgi:hypothetical protein
MILFQCFRIMPTADVTPTSKWSRTLIMKCFPVTYLANSDFFFPKGEGAEPHWSVQTSKLILIQRLNKILLRKITFPVFHLIWGPSFEWWSNIGIGTWWTECCCGTSSWILIDTLSMTLFHDSDTLHGSRFRYASEAPPRMVWKAKTRQRRSSQEIQPPTFVQLFFFWNKRRNFNCKNFRST